MYLKKNDGNVCETETCVKVLNIYKQLVSKQKCLLHVLLRMNNILDTSNTDISKTVLFKSKGS